MSSYSKETVGTEIRTQAERAFAAQVTEALKGDHNDLRAEAIILRAYREGVMAAYEDAATIADAWSDKNKAKQPEKSRFDIYDIQRYARTATKLVAEDIRAAAERITAPGMGGGL